MPVDFVPPILLNTDVLPKFPPAIATRREAAALIEQLPTCGIQWCGVVACLGSSTDLLMLRLALATALDRYGFLSGDDVDARRTTALEGSAMVSRWMGMREMQERRAQQKEKAMANREQKSNREKRKPKKEKTEAQKPGGKRK